MKFQVNMVHQGNFLTPNNLNNATGNAGFLFDLYRASMDGHTKMEIQEFDEKIDCSLISGLAASG